ncbi:hypothetical protein TKK_0006235 [Trichogramma kaykai]
MTSENEDSRDKSSSSDEEDDDYIERDAPLNFTHPGRSKCHIETWDEPQCDEKCPICGRSFGESPMDL